MFMSRLKKIKNYSMFVQFSDFLDFHQLKKIMEEDAKKVKGFKPYNILPVDTPGVANVFEKFPEVDSVQDHVALVCLGSSFFYLWQRRAVSAYLSLALSASLD